MRSNESSRNGSRNGSRRKLLALACAVAMTALAGCTAGSDEPGESASGVLAANWGGFPESWAPGAEMEAGYMRVPYENLVALDAQGEVQPVLATEWDQTDEALTLTLREGVTFHDGTLFDAEAVKVNLESIRDGKTAYAGPLKVIKSVDAVDARTVRINLSEPAPSLLTQLSTRGAPMGSPKAIKAGTIAQTPVGTGPWAYDAKSSTKGTRMSFAYYDGYWGGEDSVGFRTIELYAIPEDTAATGALSTGEISLTDTEANQFSRIDRGADLKHLGYPAIRNNPMFFDRGNGGAFEDVRVRQAACYALDTEEIAKLEPDFKVRSQHFSEGEQGHNPGVTGYTHDLDKAKELMAEAGNPQIEVEMLAAPFNEKQMQVYAQQLAKIGIKVSVQAAAPPQYFSQWNSGRYALGLGGNDELTPYDWYKAWFAEQAPGNPSKTESAELKEAAAAAIAAGASEEADELWRNVTKIISDEALTCAHVAGEELIAWNTKRVTGVKAPTQLWETNAIDYKALRPAGE
ncbi:ABC transporter substrate-binding protein [Streptomyces sp. KLOTTS4A1]|uniref:ABC transporter substrate-binding protein n=1 Tax=Streptomyces sp. KLOTTS4A1 TaxID=3390996 RepID=UPI0039F5B32B